MDPLQEIANRLTYNKRLHHVKTTSDMILEYSRMVNEYEQDITNLLSLLAAYEEKFFKGMLYSGPISPIEAIKREIFR